MHFMCNWGTRETAENLRQHKNVSQPRNVFHCSWVFIITVEHDFFESKNSKFCLLQNWTEKHFFYFYYSNAIKRIMKNLIVVRFSVSPKLKNKNEKYFLSCRGKEVFQTITIIQKILLVIEQGLVLKAFIIIFCRFSRRTVGNRHWSRLLKPFPP